MGTWGAGNFDSDNAHDWVGIKIIDPIIATIEQGMPEHGARNGETIMAAVETLAILCEHIPVYPLETADVVAKWRAAYLKSWHGYIDLLDPTPGFKATRLNVIGSTFDRLDAVIRKAVG